MSDLLKFLIVVWVVFVIIMFFIGFGFFVIVCFFVMGKVLFIKL